MTTNRQLIETGLEIAFGTKRRKSWGYDGYVPSSDPQHTAVRLGARSTQPVFDRGHSALGTFSSSTSTGSALYFRRCDADRRPAKVVRLPNDGPPADLEERRANPGRR